MRVRPSLVTIRLRSLLAIGLIHVGILAGFTFLAVRLQELGSEPSAIALSAGTTTAELAQTRVAEAIAALSEARRAVMAGFSRSPSLRSMRRPRRTHR